MSKTVFDLYKVKIIFFLHFTSLLTLKKSKNMFPPIAGFKKVFILNFFVDFRVMVQIFTGLATKERGNMKFWNWGPTTIWHNIQCVAFSSKSLHPTVFASPPDLYFLVLYHVITTHILSYAGGGTTVK